MFPKVCGTYASQRQHMRTNIQFLPKVRTQLSNVGSCLTFYMKQDIFFFNLKNVKPVYITFAQGSFDCTANGRHLCDCADKMLLDDSTQFLPINIMMKMHHADVLFATFQHDLRQTRCSV